MKQTNLFKTLVLTGIILLLLVSLRSDTVAQTWTQLVPSTAKPSHTLRIWSSAVYDQASNRMIIFGGKPDGSCTFVSSTNDAWVLENANGLGGSPAWTQLSPSGGPPAGRRGHSSLYDPASNRMIVFSGDPNCGCTRFNDVWVLTNANGIGTPQWVQLATSGGPPTGRTEGVAYYNSASNRLIVFGGFNCSGGTRNDVWVLSNANGIGGTPTWTQLSPGFGPSVRGRHIGGYDPMTNRMFIYSGQSFCCWGGDFTELWVLTNADGTGGSPAWTLLPQSGGIPASRLDSAAHIYDPATNRFMVYGDGFSSNTDVWVLANANGSGGTPVWTMLSTSGTGPAVPQHGKATYDPATTRLIVFSLQDVWVLTNANGIATLDVNIDIKFCSNPNGFNCKKRGALPVTIFGSADLDVNEIDVSTVQLCLASGPDDPANCISAVDAQFPEDRGDPDTDLGAAQCAVIDGVEQRFLNPDGFEDLDVLFNAPQVATLTECSTLSKGAASSTLVIKGELNDDTPFISIPEDSIGIDQLLIQTK